MAVGKKKELYLVVVPTLITGRVTQWFSSVSDCQGGCY